MNTHYKHMLGIGFVLALCTLSISTVWAAEKPQVSLEVVPVSYTTVTGDATHFRAQNWVNDGFTYGIKDLTVAGKLDKKTEALFETYGMPNDNSYGGAIDVIREGVGFVKMDYNTFRKYYDNHGGTYYPFSLYSNYAIDQDLHMDIGHIAIEIGETFDNLPAMSLFYEQHTKDGKKSRLSWGSAIESSTKAMTPSWQDVQETVNSFGLRGSGAVKGFDIKGEQKWEFVRAHLLREETFLSQSNATAKKRQHELDPESDSMTTSLRGERWFWKDKGYLALGYRYNKIDNNENENIRETDIYGNPSYFSNGHNKFNAMADNKYESNVFTGNFVSEPMKNLNFISKVKTEIVGRRGGSVYPSDTTNPPNGVPNTTEISSIESKFWRWGENVGLRYSGIKKTSIYGDVELEQTKNWLDENRDSLAGETSASSGEVFYRETRTNSSKYVISLGSRTALSKLLNFTTQFRHRNEDNDYDDMLESAATSSGSKSAFFDFLQVGGNEFTTKWSFKPIKQATGSIRYQYQDYYYVARTEDSINQEATTLSNIFTYNLMLQPIDSLMLDLGYSRQLSKTSTPASAGASPQLPGFRSNVNSWYMTSSYILSEKLSLVSIFNKSSQNNYNDFTSISLPYGVDAKWYDTSVGLKWAYSKTMTLEPKYTYYSYSANPLTGGGNYRAHTVLLGVNLNWF